MSTNATTKPDCAWINAAAQPPPRPASDGEASCIRVLHNTSHQKSE